MKIWFKTFIVEIAFALSTLGDAEVKEPSLCEVCKFLATELGSRLEETGKSKEKLRVGHSLDDKRQKTFDYSKSELRLTEALHEPHVCEKILQYNIHAERKGSLRYAKGRSETMQTLHGLVDKGVKVDLGIPYDLWDAPQAEVTLMQKKCFKLVEDYEEDIEEWYQNAQHTDLTEYLCRNVVLRSHDAKCLDEREPSSSDPSPGSDNKKSKTKSKVKGEESQKKTDHRVDL